MSEASAHPSMSSANARLNRSPGGQPVGVLHARTVDVETVQDPVRPERCDQHGVTGMVRPVRPSRRCDQPFSFVFAITAIVALPSESDGEPQRPGRPSGRSVPRTPSPAVNTPA
jgi:hypothetical protein